MWLVLGMTQRISFNMKYLLLFLLIPSLAQAVTLPEENNPDNYVSGNLSSDIADTNSTAVIAAQGASIRTCVRDVVVTNGSTTVNTRVDILDGSTVKHSAFAFANGGGWVARFDPPLCGTANTAWNAQAATTSAAVRVTLSGFKIRR